ncbi:hypothetical protein ACIP6X_35910 [Streptomyces coeruleorubidus]|uniref:hypothetical protein n=1 Tax=Streptomyces coeruleorubidus TaxID=116188 RepID=UPI00381F466A
MSVMLSWGYVHHQGMFAHSAVRARAPRPAVMTTAFGWTARPPRIGIQRGMTSPQGRTRPIVRKARSSLTMLSVSIQTLVPGDWKSVKASSV